jgi:uncharacterized membrane protein
MDGWTIVRFLHVLALAFFVGGQLMLVTAIVPAIRKHGDEAAMRAIAKRFGIGATVALGVLVATGAAMASHLSRWEEGALQAKLALVVVIAVLTGLHIVTPYTRAVSVAIFVSSLTIVYLGVRLTHGAF